MVRIGYDIGGTNLAAGVLDDNNQLIAKTSLPFPRGKGIAAVIVTCRTLFDSLLETASLSAEKITGVGVAVPGSVDPEKGVVIDAHNLGFHHTPLSALLEDALQKPIALINDADAAALAEHGVGSLSGTQTSVMITIGTGIGGGVILNGRLFRGGRGNGTEPGHMVLHNGGRHCTCGVDGCAETYCSATRLAKDGSALGYSGAKEVIDAAKAGNAQACELFRMFIDDLGSYLASIINLLDPERIAVGGGVCGAGEFLLNPLRKDAERKCFFETCPEIVIATAGNDAGIIGACLIAEK